MKKGKVINFRKYLLIAIFIATVFMSIGYATVNSVTLDVGGKVSVEAFKGLFIYDINIDPNSNANLEGSKIDLFYETMVQSKVVLNNNVNSSLTMNVTIYNKSNDDVYYDNAIFGDSFYDNDNIDFTVNGITHGQKLAQGGNVSFTITFKYTDEYKASNPSEFDSILNSYINFRFIHGYSITYVGFGDVSGLPDLILEEESKSITFNNTSGIPTSVTVTGASGGYVNPVLTLTNATGNVTVTGVFPSSQTSTEIVNNPDGSTSTITTEYDSLGNIITQTTETEDTSGYTITQELTYVNGDPIVTAYDIDIGSNTTGYSVPSGGIDTGVIAFDGNDFVATITVKLTHGNCTKTICPIINISEKNPSVNGVLIYESRSTSGKGHDENGTNVNTPYNKFRFGKYVNNSATGSDDYNIASRVTQNISQGRYGYGSSSSPITLTFKVYNTGGNFTSEIYNASGTLIAKPHNDVVFNFGNTGTGFEDITVTIGHFVSSTSATYNHEFEILDFNVTKTLN